MSRRAVASSGVIVVMAVLSSSCATMKQTYEENSKAILGLGIIAYFTLLCLPFYGRSRYHFPIMPWVAMYAAALPDTLLGRREMRSPSM